MSGPLEGIRVLDLSAHLAGPFCTMHLGDMGAEVIKIEPPSGDYSRIMVVPEAKGQAPYFLSVNRNKKGVHLNLKNEEALNAFYELVEKSDVVIENYRQGVAKKLKVDYDTLKKINPKIVYASISGFGQEGPYKDRPSFDIIAQATSGMVHLTSMNVPDHVPIRVAGSIGDTIPGLFTAIAILAALSYAARTGKGQYIDIAQAHSLTAAMPIPIQNYLITKKESDIVSKEFPLRTLRAIYPTKDGHIAIAAHFHFMEILVKTLAEDMPEILDEWTDNMALSEKAHGMLVEWIRGKTNEELDEIFTRAKLPFGLVAKPSDLLVDPQAEARNMFVEIQHPLGFAYKTVRSPIIFSETPVMDYRAPPTFSQDTHEVLKRLLGYSDDDIGKLRKMGAIL